MNRLLVICFLVMSFSGAAQDSLKNKRLKPLLIAGSATYATSLVVLNQLWYADFDRQPFHFFNDNREWKQQDKIGHFYSAFQISQLAYSGLTWAGVQNNKAILWGALTSSIVLLPIEIFDGFSAEYGASTGDIIANSAGGVLFYGQQKLWGEIRLHPKFSFNRSPYPQFRPELLGTNLSEEIVKDYNAHTYWVSIDLSKFHSAFPKWLNVAVGHSADGMVSANDDTNIANGFAPTRRFYFAVDFDFNEYKSKSKLINTLIYMVNMIKLPAPTLELSNSKIRAHSFYY